MAVSRKTPAAARKTKGSRATQRMVVLVATRKGAWLYHGDAERRTWRADGPHFLGQRLQKLLGVG